MSTENRVKIPFENNKGEVMELDEDRTVKDLVKIGVKEIRLVPPSSPLPDNRYVGVGQRKTP